jgi:ribosomal protein S27E
MEMAQAGGPQNPATFVTSMCPSCGREDFNLKRDDGVITCRSCAGEFVSKDSGYAKWVENKDSEPLQEDSLKDALNKFVESADYRKTPQAQAESAQKYFNVPMRECPKCEVSIPVTEWEEDDYLCPKCRYG